MEVTGLAYEEMQEQNSRLLQQLKEKDDANFKLMSDRIKANQLHKLLREEKQVLEEQVSVSLSLNSFNDSNFLSSLLGSLPANRNRGNARRVEEAGRKGANFAEHSDHN